MTIRTVAFAIALAAAACGPSKQNYGGDGGSGGADGGDNSCSAGAQRCTGNTLESCVDGSFEPMTECPQACDNVLGCVVCQPNTGTCMGEVSHQCKPDGSGYVDVTCDSAQGVTCNTGTGLCEGACAPSSLGKSYIGCDYYPVVTGNMVNGNVFEFAVAVSNTSNQQAQITIDEGGLSTPITFTVAPGDVVVRTLPWNDALKLCTGGTSTGCGNPVTPAALSAKGAFHLRSTHPVTVYQFSPLDYQQGVDYSYTNDASLLLPTNVWTGNYVVAAWTQLDADPVSGATWPGLMAVTAREDDTTVTITATANVPAGGGAPAFTAGVPSMVTLNRGDTLELTGPGTYGVTPLADLTGTFVSADKPVQVVGGHYCAYVPGDLSIGYCDHMEESMFPIETLSKQYIVTAPAVPSLPNGKEEMVRIIATAANTTITYDPPQSGAGTTLALPGDFIEIARQLGNYVITADEKVMVVQYMEGQEAGGNTGDPAMSLAVATDQYRSEYRFHAPTNYETNYVNVTAPVGANVMIDGVLVTGYTNIGASGFQFARVTLGQGTSGNHTATGDMPFGISVYGYGQYTSYWYPGGLDLDVIPVD
jgi:hypothetical protein